MFKANKNILLIIVFIIVFSKSSTQSQGDLEPTYTIRNTSQSGIYNVRWSNDSTRLVFSEGWYEEDEAPPSYPIWIDIDTTSDEVTYHLTWPLQPIIDSELKANLGIVDETKLFISPNGRYIVHGTERDNDSPYLYPMAITISNLETGEQVILGGRFYPYIEKNYNFIWWSANSSTFIYRYDGGFGVFPHCYISGLDENFTGSNCLDTRLFEYDDYNQIIVSDNVPDGDSFVAGTPTDIDEDGHRVIFIHRNHWLIWDTNDPTQTRRIIHENDKDHIYSWAEDLVFAPYKENAILAINKHGLFFYDLETGESFLLSKDIHADQQQAFFSPDGLKLALIDSSQSNVFIIELEPYLQQLE